MEKPKFKTGGASADAVVGRRNRRGFFISAESEALDRDVTTFEAGYDSDISRLTVGTDYEIGEQWIAGFAFDTSEQDLDFVGGGDSDVKSYGIVGFGSFLPTEKTFVQFYGGFTRNEYDRTRFATFTQLDGTGSVDFTTSGVPDADYDADQFSAGILVGYDYSIDNVTIGPRVAFDWNDTDFDTHSETDPSGLGLTFHDDEVTSLQSSVGVQASVALRSGSWVVVPQASLIWKHEFDQDQRDVTVSFVGDTRAKRFSYETKEPDRNSGEIILGIVAVSPNGLQVFGNYRTLVEHEFFDSDALTIGLRAAF